jgi:hypothetical protein
VEGDTDVGERWTSVSVGVGDKEAPASAPCAPGPNTSALWSGGGIVRDEVEGVVGYVTGKGG